MRSAPIVLLIVVLVFSYAESDELPLALPCDETTCKLPECRCSKVDIPGGLEPRNTPQFVLLTFDDEVTELNTMTFRSLIFNRTNKNQCHIGVTFFLRHEYTDYSMVNELYNQGFEIALHSITHRMPVEFWRDATHEELMREIGDQIQQVSVFANISSTDIRGVRSPFLQMSGNNTFKMMQDAGLLYDVSWPTITYTNPGLWPYTLHYKSIQDCPVTPCPTASIPGPWVIPMISWTDLQGYPCALADSCIYSPDTEEGWFQFFLENFERHYLGNRAPFGIYFHEVYFTTRPYILRALNRFLDILNNINDVLMVNAKDVIEWVQDPIPINEYIKKDCRTITPAPCHRSVCPPLFNEETQLTYYNLGVCGSCPRVHPWVNNPLGL